MQEVTYENLVAMQQQNPALVLIDVREAAEHSAGNIGGINIPLSEFAQRTHEVPKDVPVVLYCRSGGRSGMAVAALTQTGWNNVLNLAGGLLNIPE